MQLEKVYQEQKRSEKHETHDQARCDDKQPVLPRMPPSGLLVSDEQVVIAAIRLPGYMGEIADDWDCAERALQRQVEKHAN